VDCHLLFSRDLRGETKTSLMFSPSPLQLIPFFVFLLTQIYKGPKIFVFSFCFNCPFFSGRLCEIELFETIPLLEFSFRPSPPGPLSHSAAFLKSSGVPPSVRWKPCRNSLNHRILQTPPLEPFFHLNRPLFWTPRMNSF